MDFRQLEVFSAVMKTGSTVGAAQFLGVSQPSISNTIRHLEDVLEFDLFDRAHGRLIPTEDAKILYNEVQGALVAVGNLRRFADEMKQSHRGALVLAATPTLGNSVLPSAIAMFSRARPEVKIVFRIEQLEEVLQMVDQGTADVGICLNAFRMPSVVLRPIKTLPLVCIVHKNHALAARPAIRPCDMAEHPLISYARDTVLGNKIEAAFRSAGFGRKINIEIRYTETACALVQKEAGIAIVDQFVLRRNSAFPDVVMRPFLPSVPATAFLVQSSVRRSSRLAQQFVKTLNRTFLTWPEGELSTSCDKALERSFQ